MPDTNYIYRFYEPAEIERYLRGDMNAQEMHELEKTALKDPLLADAIDGLKNANTHTTRQHLQEIKTAILGLDSREAATPIVPLRVKPIKWWRWGAAACILGLISVVTWNLLLTDTQRTNTPVAAQITQPTVEDSGVNRKSVTSETAPLLSLSTRTVPSQQAKVTAASPTPAINSAKKEKSTEIPETGRPSTAPPTEEKGKQLLAMSTASEPPKESLRRESYAKASFSRQATTAPLPAPGKISGKILDEAGIPISQATLSTAGETAGKSVKDGSFSLSADSSLQVAISSVGHENSVATLQPGSENQVKLARKADDPNEKVIIGYSRPQKRLAKAKMADYSQFQKEARKTWKNEIMYPEEGWAHFYQQLGKNLGSHASTSKKLEIKFTVDDNGDPVDFQVVESPDELVAKKAIEMIKKAKWKNFKKDNNATVMIRLD